MEQGDDGTSLSQVACITALPAVAMAIGSAAISVGEPSDRLQATLQHLSAGLLIGAVIADIFPLLKKRLGGPGNVNVPNCAAAVVGVVLALILMYGLKSLDLDEGGDESSSPSNRKTKRLLSEPLLGEESPEEVNRQISDHFDDSAAGCKEEASQLRKGISRLQASTDALASLVADTEVDREAVDEQVHMIQFLVHSALRVSRGAQGIDERNAQRLRHHVHELKGDIEELKKIDLKNLKVVHHKLKNLTMTLNHVHEHAERGKFRRWRAAPKWAEMEQQLSNGSALGSEALALSEEQPQLPWGLICAVTVDSCVDGMLIGLAAGVAIMSGWLMAMATAIEMCFLGYSFACSLAGKARLLTTVCVLAIPPASMLAASCAACVATDLLQHSCMFAGLMAFALVALLFLVLQELLLEAQEKEGSEVWQVSVWLYIGLFLSLGLDVVL